MPGIIDLDEKGLANKVGHVARKDDRSGLLVMRDDGFYISKLGQSEFPINDGDVISIKSNFDKRKNTRPEQQYRVNL